MKKHALVALFSLLKENLD